MQPQLGIKVADAWQFKFCSNRPNDTLRLLLIVHPDLSVALIVRRARVGHEINDY